MAVFSSAGNTTKAMCLDCTAVRLAVMSVTFGCHPTSLSDRCWMVWRISGRSQGIGLVLSDPHTAILVVQ